MNGKAVFKNKDLKVINQIPPKIINIFAFLTFIVLLIAIFTNSMVKPIGHDEQMYCTAGALIADGKMIYRDFSYVAQMPYHPLLCAALFKILNTNYYLLTARILSSICDIFTLICIVGIYRWIFSSFKATGLLLGLAFAVLYAFNPYVNFVNGFAWNHDVVVLCVILSFWIFLITDFKHKSKYWKIAVIGALLTFATWSRATTGLVQLLFFVFLLLQPAESLKQRLKNIFPFLAATLFVSLWPIWIVIQSQKAFFLNIFRIQLLNGQWQHQFGFAQEKIKTTLLFLTTPSSFLLILIAIYLCVTLILNRRKLAISNAKIALFAILLTVAFFIIAFIPATMWLQYYGVPIPFLLICFAYPLLCLKKLADDKPFKIAFCIIAAAVLVTITTQCIVLRRIPKLFNLQNWTPIQLHDISQDIAKRCKEPKLILTLAPLFAIEGGAEPYIEFSAGAFVYRVADSMTPAELQITRTVSPKTLRTLLGKSSPSAVVLGLEPEILEEPIYQTVIHPDRKKWEKKIYENNLVVYFRR